MLLFDYSCEDCGHVEEDRTIREHNEEVLCPMCNHRMKKLFTGISIRGDGLGNDHRVDENILGGGDVRFGNRTRSS